MRQEQGREGREERVIGCAEAHGCLMMMRPETQALDFRCGGHWWQDWLQKRGGDRSWMGVCPRMNGKTETGNSRGTHPVKTTTEGEKWGGD